MQWCPGQHGFKNREPTHFFFILQGHQSLLRLLYKIKEYGDITVTHLYCIKRMTNQNTSSAWEIIEHKDLTISPHININIYQSTALFTGWSMIKPASNRIDVCLETLLKTIESNILQTTTSFIIYICHITMHVYHRHI